MGELGADPEALRELAAAMRAESRRIAASTRRATVAVRNASWRGRDAQRFGSTWARHSRVMVAATEQLDDAAEDLERNASEQLRASSASGTAGGDDRSTASPDSGGPPRPAPPSASIGSTPIDPGPPPFGDPLPRRTESWEIAGALATGLGVSGTARVVVSELPGGRSVVRLEDIDEVNASTGTSVDVGVQDGPGVELGAEVGGSLAKHTRDAWEVDSDDVADLLVHLGVRELAGAGTLSPGIPIVGPNPLAPLLDHAAGLFGLSAPDPDVSDLVLTLGGSAAVTAAAGLPVLGASGAVVESIGLRERDHDSSLVVELGAEYSTTVPGGGPSGASASELEVQLGESGTQHLIVTSTEQVPGGEVVDRSVYGYDSDTARRLAREATSAVRSGDVEGASDAVAALWRDVELEPLWNDRMGGVVNDDVHSIDAGAALGAEVSASVTGGRRITTYAR